MAVLIKFLALYDWEGEAFVQRIGMFSKVPVLLFGQLLWGLSASIVLPPKKSEHQFRTWMAIQLPYILTISLRISFTVFPSTIKTQIMLRTSFTLNITNSGSITMILIVRYLIIQ